MAVPSLEPTLGPAEPAYRAHFLRADVAQLRAVIVAALTLGALSVVSERLLNHQLPVGILVGTRAVLVAISVAALVALGRVRSPQAFDRTAVVWLLAVVGQSVALTAARPASAVDVVALVMLTLGVYLLIPVPFALRAACAGLATIGIGLAHWFGRGEQQPDWLAVFVIGTAALNGLGAWFSARMHNQRRREYSAQQTLRASVAERDALIHQLRQTRQMASLGRLAAGVAHDFNNILGTIRVPVQLLFADTTPTEAQRADIQILEDAVQRGQQLTAQLLAFSRQQPLAPRLVSLNDLMPDIGRLLARTLGPEIRVDMALAPDLARVRVDPGQVGQVVLNLALNARDAMPGRGTITISTHNAPDCRVVLAVADTGAGMDAETQAHIFEPFFTTKGAGGGTGLGLATVYGIVEQSGGEIRVTSAPGAGTRFEVVLPAARD